jgi:hypothetical protein
VGTWFGLVICDLGFGFWILDFGFWGYIEVCEGERRRRRRE